MPSKISIPAGFSIDQVVPWGRGFDEYVRFFSLNEEDLSRRIIDCGGGPSDFAAQMHRRGNRSLSADPLYAFSAAEIRRRIDETYPMIMEQAERNRDGFLWTEFSGVAELGRRRLASMENFLADFDPGRAEGRYVPERLPSLSFSANCFDLALCSHFLFLYTEQVDLETHWEAISEMLRVAPEARIFPLISLRGDRSAHLDEILSRCAASGWTALLERVPYEFQRGGNEMLRIRR